MKKRVLQFRMAKNWMIALLIGVTGKMYAYDFSAVCETGQTLYYNITDATNHYVELTYPSTEYQSYWSGYTEPSGLMILPSSVTNNNVHYTVKSVGEYSFCECYSLTSVIIPNTVTAIRRSAFEDCWNITSINVPNDVTYIGNSSFSGCSKIYTFSIPNTVVTIGKEAFFNTGWYNTQSNGLLYLDNCCLGYKTSISAEQVEIQNGTRIIANSAFYECLQLKEIRIPNTVVSIGTSAFSKCYYLTFVSLGNSLLSIGQGSFFDCIRLSSVIIPRTVTSIGYQAFYGCTSLSSVTMLGTTPPALDQLAFNNNSNTQIINVPYQSISNYKTSVNWSNYASRISPMAYKSISGYAEDNGNWQFIASPLVESTSPATIEDMLPTAGTYDLYQFNQSATGEEWQNYKANSFNLTNGQGYLYANTEEVNLIFKGEFNEDETKEISLAYDANANIAGWNLVGNPFPVSAYANRSYYVMNEAGTAIEPVAVSMETAIPTCTGVMVKADNTGETVTFSKAVLRGKDNQGVLQIALTKANTRSNAVEDKVLVSFNEGDQLGKFVFNKDSAKLYIPQGKGQYAIAYAETTSEIPLNFEAHKNGSYVISVNPEMAEMAYLHLIDNLTGDDVDLLAEPNYSFEAKASDYASRFKLVFSANAEDCPSTGSGTFAYINSSSNLTIYGIEGEVILQVVDMQGHVLSSETFNGYYEKKLNVAPGVYMLRLIQGDDVKTQKIVVR